MSICLLAIIFLTKKDLWLLQIESTFLLVHLHPAKVVHFHPAGVAHFNPAGVVYYDRFLQYDADIFGKVMELLKKYDRSEHALMIGTDESTPFFTGKIKLSCTVQQLQDNMLKPGFSPKDYYLFSKNISKEEVEWAKKHGILVVGAINAWAFKGDAMMDEVREVAKKLKEAGVDYYQIDSIFDFLFI